MTLQSYAPFLCPVAFLGHWYNICKTTSLQAVKLEKLKYLPLPDPDESLKTVKLSLNIYHH